MHTTPDNGVNSYVEKYFRPKTGGAGCPSPGARSAREYDLREYSRSRDIYLVKNLLGHSAVAVTERYLKFPLDYLEREFGQSDTRIPMVEKSSVYSTEKSPFEA